MCYSKEDIADLMNSLNGFGSCFEVLRDFFSHHLEEKNLEFGLSVPGSQGSALVIEELADYFPDVLHALSVPETELLLYINPDIGLEYPIACWRLWRMGKPHELLINNCGRNSR